MITIYKMNNNKSRLIGSGICLGFFMNSFLIGKTKDGIALENKNLKLELASIERRFRCRT